MHRWLTLALVLFACDSNGADDLTGPGAPAAGQGGAGDAGAGGEGGEAADGGNAGQGGGAGSAPLVCAPGQSIACVGPGACQGGQVCNPDGSGYGPCDCGPAGGAGGSSAGAGGQPAAGKGGGSCVPLTEAQACAANQCGVASDGCGGEVSCSPCKGWQTCEIEQGAKVCNAVCQLATDLLPEEQCTNYPKMVGKPIAVVCTPVTISQIDHEKCLNHFTKPAPGGDRWYACCTP